MRSVITPVVAGLALLLAACTSNASAPEATTTAEATPTVEATAKVTPTAASTAASPPVPTATPSPLAPLTAEAAAIVDASIAALAGWLGASPELLSLDYIVRTDWPDSCLGAGRPDEGCDTAIVPGYLVRIFLGGEWSYQVRSNLDGSQLVWSTDWVVEGTFLGADERLQLLSIAGDFPNALDPHGQQYGLYPGSDTAVVGSLRYGDPVLVAGDGRPSSDVPLLIWIELDPSRDRPAADDPDRVAGAAGQALGVMLESVGLELASIEAIEWSDSCLEVPRPGVHCSEVRFPGYRMRFDHESGASYEMRSDQQGSQFAWVGDRVVEGIVREVTVATSLRVETDGGELIWARVLAGSSLDEPIASSLLNDRLRLMLAPHPQGSGWAIVILEQLAEG